jgi:hypothetical protein
LEEMDYEEYSDGGFGQKERVGRMQVYLVQRGILYQTPSTVLL